MALAKGVVFGEHGIPNLGVVSQSLNALVRIIFEVVDGTNSVALMAEPMERCSISILALETKHLH